MICGRRWGLHLLLWTTLATYSTRGQLAVVSRPTPPLSHPIDATGQSTADVRLLDLNTASAHELAALDGMGPVYAKRVIEGRPYRAKNQLVTRGVLPAAAYLRIRDHIIARRPTR